VFADKKNILVFGWKRKCRNELHARSEKTRKGRKITIEDEEEILNI
jgi:hypothetical protein